MMFKNDDKNISDVININNSQLNFIPSNRFSKFSSITRYNSNFQIKDNLEKSLLTILLQNKSLINSFECENDSTLGAGEYSFLIYGGQYLTLYNIDGILHRITWNTNQYDSIKQIRWSSYYRSYLIMTARLFSLFLNELLEIKIIFPLNQQLQLFTCHYKDLWLVCLLNKIKTQILVHYDLSQWERNQSDIKHISLDKFGVYKTDYICAIENDQHGQFLALLIAERNRNITVGIQRRRRLILISIFNMSLMRIIYFSGADDLYCTLTSFNYRKYSKTGWLLSKCFDNELTFLDNKCNSKLTCIKYKNELRNLAITTDGQYLIIRTINNLDIYQIY